LRKYPPIKITVPDHVRGLIFDCDGTLVDSMPLHMKAWEYAVKHEGGVWDREFFYSKCGMTEENIIDLYNATNSSPLNPVKTVQTKHNYFRRHRGECKPIMPVVDLVLRYRDVLPMAVASGGTSDNVHFQLDTIGLKDCFKIILTADDDIRPKPDPDIFIEAAKRLGIPSNLCQVFEDGDLGLHAAQKAGMLATDVRPFLII
jgi:beta-phosphoglucomutase-like phosphatase (HAD superfamily)